MESQMVQNSRNKIGLTFNKFVIKVKTDFSQAQQNQFTFNLFSLKVKTFRIKLNKITSSLSRNYLSRARDIWVKLKRSLSLLSTRNLSQFHASFLNHLTFQGQAANAVNNPNTLSTAMPSAVNKVINRYFVYCSWSIYRHLFGLRSFIYWTQ